MRLGFEPSIAGASISELHLLAATPHATYGALAMSPVYHSARGVVAALVLLLGAANVLAEDCVHGARYVRKGGSYIQIGPATDSDNGSATAKVEMQALGNVAPDGAPRYGNLDGEISLTRNRCAGVVSSPENSCSLIVIFTNKTAKVYEVGYCFTGTGVYGAGLYVKAKEGK